MDFQSVLYRGGGGLPVYEILLSLSYIVLIVEVEQQHVISVTVVLCPLQTFYFGE